MVHDPQVARYSLVLQYSSYKQVDHIKNVVNIVNKETRDGKFIHCALMYPFDPTQKQVLGGRSGNTLKKIHSATQYINCTENKISPAGMSILSPWLAMMITVPRRLT